MPRLTAELIASAPAYMNPLNERELCLRSYRLPAIESLGATADEYDALDLSHNQLSRLDNFPLLVNLTTLVCHHNAIRRISNALHAALPRLSHLALSHNALAQHTDLAPLARCQKLVWLDVTGCPLARLPDYRLRVLHVLPRLRVLDYNRVKQSERRESERQYGVYAPQEEERKEAVGTVAMEEEERKEVGAGKGAADRDMAAHMAQLIERIQQATSLDEIAALEQQLSALSQQQQR